MKRAWLLPGERMPVGRPAAPQLRFARTKRWIAELGYEPRVLFGTRLRATRGRGTARAVLDALLTVAVVPWLVIRAWYERPSLILSTSVLNAPILVVIKRLFGDRVAIVVDLLGVRSLESQQTTRRAALRPILGFVWRRLERASLGTADLVLTVNERSAELAREASPGTRVAVLRDAAEEELAAIEPADRRDYGIPEDAVAIGFVGSIVCSRLDRLISAWEELRERDGPALHLVVVGDGPDLPGYRRWAERQAAGSVTFTGSLARDEALAVLRACDIAYTGSWSQAGFSFKLFEYLALGMPILAERKPQMEEVLTDGDDALLYEGASELGAKIAELAADTELRHLLGAEASRTLHDGHTVEHRADRFRELVADVEERPRLHLLEVGLNWPPETFIRWRLQALAARGMRVTVAANRRPGARIPRRRRDGIEVIEIPFWENSRAQKLLSLTRNGLPLLVRHPRRTLAVIREARRALPPDRKGLLGLLGELDALAPLARLRPDLVHFDWESAAVRFLPLYDIWDCPVVISCHGAGVNRHPIGKRLQERVTPCLPTAFAKATAVHCVADQVADHAVQWGASPESIHVIRSAVDPGFFSPADSVTGPSNGPSLQLTSVARLIPTKGYEYALSAIRLLVDADVPVEYEILGGDPGPWGGEPSDRARIQYTIKDLCLDDHVRLRGNVTSTEVRDRLRRTDVFVHPSLSDGLPTVIVEAMSCAVPVVVTDAGGTPELVNDRLEGFVVGRRDPVALAEALERLWADASLRERMGRAGRDRVEQEFSLDQLADRFLEMLESAASH